MARPNILLIHSDQHRYDCLGVNGHPFIQTPNLDRLAREGVRYTQAFCTSPVCSPTRASLMSGVWPAQHGCLATEIGEAYRPMLPTLPTYSQCLNGAGYYLGYVGKWHVDENRDPLCYGFHDYTPTSSYAEWRRTQGLTAAPRQNGYFGEADPYICPQQSRLAWEANFVIERLDKAQQQDRPFFIRWDPVEPHLPNVVPEPYASMYPPATIPPWPTFPDPLHHKPYIQKQQLRNWGIEEWTWDEWTPLVSRYLGDISLLDAQIGRILGYLERVGLADNTVVIYTTDHGDMCGGHGMIDKHYVMYEDVVHVPLLVRWPGHIAPETICDAFVSSAIDLAATFCALAQTPTPTTFQGLNLLDLRDPMHPQQRQDIFAVYYGNQFGLYSQRMVRDRRWKYVWNPTAEDELYDLEQDPAELSNLAADCTYAHPLQKLRERMISWLAETKDPLLNRWTRTQLATGNKL